MTRGCSAVVVFVFLALHVFFMVQGTLHSYNEKCDESKNITTIKDDNATTIIDTIQDSCDAEKFLTCLNTRCICKDQANQIFSMREYRVNVRSKRGSKKGKKGASLGKAAAVGVVAGVGAYQLNKGLDNLAHSGTNYQTSSNQKTKKIQKFSCFARVGANCAIRPDKLHTVTTISNVTGTPVTTTRTIQYDKEMSECVENAECKEKANPLEDTNIGECVCRAGYVRSKTDICVRDKKNGGGQNAGTPGLNVFLIGAVALAQVI